MDTLPLYEKDGYELMDAKVHFKLAPEAFYRSLSKKIERENVSSRQLTKLIFSIPVKSKYVKECMWVQLIRKKRVILCRKIGQ